MKDRDKLLQILSLWGNKVPTNFIGYFHSFNFITDVEKEGLDSFFDCKIVLKIDAMAGQAHPGADENRKGNHVGRLRDWQPIWPLGAFGDIKNPKVGDVSHIPYLREWIKNKP